ncbi:MAG TPA: dihydrofolate reductase family protein [Pseudonocardiaceae bacterium]|nr:dihydrofolate reductase family protein [Pseudonocardiaceae bacterium]
MRKLIAHMMTTIDGYIGDAPGLHRLTNDWTNLDDEMRGWYTVLFGATDTLMFGRVIYQELVPHWTAVADGRIPGSTWEVGFGSHVRRARKIVVSSTLRDVPVDTTVIGGDLAAEVNAIKATEGSDILLYTGPALLATLSRLGLIDEYLVSVHPIAIGRGTSLFGGLNGPLRLELVSSKRFRSGSLVNRYR